jgi:hypothetical protein
MLDWKLIGEDGRVDLALWEQRRALGFTLGTCHCGAALTAVEAPEIVYGVRWVSAECGGGHVLAMPLSRVVRPTVERVPISV